MPCPCKFWKFGEWKKNRHTNGHTEKLESGGSCSLCGVAPTIPQPRTSACYCLGREISPSRRCQQARVSGWKHPGGESRGYQVLYTLSTSLRNQGKALPLRHLSEPDPGGRICQFSSGLRHWSLTWSCPRQQHMLTRGFIQSLYIHWRIPLFPTEESLLCLTVPKGESKIAGWQNRKLRNHISTAHRKWREWSAGTTRL